MIAALQASPTPTPMPPALAGAAIPQIAGSPPNAFSDLLAAVATPPADVPAAPPAMPIATATIEAASPIETILGVSSAVAPPAIAPAPIQQTTTSQTTIPQPAPSLPAALQTPLAAPAATPLAASLPSSGKCVIAPPAPGTISPRAMQPKAAAAPIGEDEPADLKDAPAQPAADAATQLLALASASPATIVSAPPAPAISLPTAIAAPAAETPTLPQAQRSTTPPPAPLPANPAKGVEALEAAMPFALALIEPDADTKPVVADALQPATAAPFAAPPLSKAPPADPVTAAAPLDTAQPILTAQLDLAKDSQWLDQLARDITRTATRDGEIRFHLNPEHLGSLHVAIANSADGTALSLTTETDAAHQILQDAQPRLVAEARAQGLRISETHVELAQNAGGQPAPQSFGQQPQPQQQQPRQPLPHATPIQRQAKEATDQPRPAPLAERYA